MDEGDGADLRSKTESLKVAAKRGTTIFGFRARLGPGLAPQGILRIPS